MLEFLVRNKTLIYSSCFKPAGQKNEEVIALSKYSINNKICRTASLYRKNVNRVNSVRDSVFVTFKIKS